MKTKQAVAHRNAKLNTDAGKQLKDAVAALKALIPAS